MLHNSKNLIVLQKKLMLFLLIKFNKLILKLMQSYS